MEASADKAERLGISTHTLARRVTHVFAKVQPMRQVISTHTLARRVTSSHNASITSPKTFQPTPSHGG